MSSIRIAALYAIQITWLFGGLAFWLVHLTFGQRNSRRRRWLFRQFCFHLVAQGGAFLFVLSCREASEDWHLCLIVPYAVGLASLVAACVILMFTGRAEQRQKAAVEGSE